jgi:hypothetical protein
MVVPTAQEEAAYRESVRRKQEAEAEAERRRKEEERLQKEAAAELMRRQKEEEKLKKEEAAEFLRRQKLAEAEEKQRRKEEERRLREEERERAFEAPRQTIAPNRGAPPQSGRPRTAGNAPIYCTNCGQAADPESKFCTNCGTPVAMDDVTHAAAPAESRGGRAITNPPPPTGKELGQPAQEESEEEFRIRWLCPGPGGRGCGKRLKARRELAGKTAVCPKCALKQVVPPPPSASEPATQPIPAP